MNNCCPLLTHLWKKWVLHLWRRQQNEDLTVSFLSDAIFVISFIFLDIQPPFQGKIRHSLLKNTFFLYRVFCLWKNVLLKRMSLYFDMQMLCLKPFKVLKQKESRPCSVMEHGIRVCCWHMLACFHVDVLACQHVGSPTANMLTGVGL